MLRYARIPLFAAVGLLLAGCASALMPPSAVEDLVSMDWFIGPAPTMMVAVQPPRYCYGTIGDPECHAKPLADSGNRLVGFVGPPPPGYQP